MGAHGLQRWRYVGTCALPLRNAHGTCCVAAVFLHAQHGPVFKESRAALALPRSLYQQANELGALAQCRALARCHA